MEDGRIALFRGRPEIYESIEEAVRSVRPGEEAYIVVCSGGRLVFLRVEEFLEAREAPESGEERGRGPVRVVFDQMYKGFAGIVKRELPWVEAYEILGRGISEPLERDGVTLLPAEDDYDVMKHVVRLSEGARLTVLVTGDKRLARQVEALGRSNIRVIYLPPGEAPGKELLARRLVEELRHISEP